MQIILDKLISDHVYFDTLLTDLGRELDQLNTTSRHSFERVVLKFDEFRGAIPLQHHALENMVFDLLKSCNGVADFLITSLERDHVRLDMCSRSTAKLLRDALVAVDESSCREIRIGIEEFIYHYRCHIRMEEETIFPLIKNLAHSVEWHTDVECMLRLSKNMHINSGVRYTHH